MVSALLSRINCNNLSGTLNSVETYLTIKEVGEKVPGASVNTGTWESAIYGLAHANELRGLRAQLFPQRLPTLQPKLPKKYYNNISLKKSRFDYKFANLLGQLCTKTSRANCPYPSWGPTDLWRCALNITCTKSRKKDPYKFRPTWPSHHICIFSFWPCSPLYSGSSLDSVLGNNCCWR